MPSLKNEHTQFIDELSNTPIVSGYIYIGDQNQDPVITPQTIYSDRALTVPLANPQRTGADGRSVNKIWVAAEYSIRVTDSAGVQKLNDIDSGPATVTATSYLTVDKGVNYTTTIDNHEQMINATAAITISLGDAGTMGLGYIVYVKNSHTAAITVDLDTAADTLEGTAAGSVGLAPGAVRGFVIESTPDGYLFTNPGQTVSADAVVLPEVTTEPVASEAGYGQYWNREDGAPVYTDRGGVKWNLAIGLGGLYGLGTSHDTDTDHDIQVAVGACTDSTNVVTMNLTSILTKQIDLDWTADDGGGLATGARSVADTPDVSTWYHFFLIGLADGSVDGGWDTSLTATNLLSDSSYTYYRRIASHYSNASSNIDAYTQVGDKFYWAVPILSFNGSTSVSAANVTLRTPLGVQMLANIRAELEGTISTTSRVYATDMTAAAPSAANRSVRITTGAGQTDSAFMDLMTDTSSQVAHDHADNGESFDISTHGWTDTRGKP